MTTTDGHIRTPEQDPRPSPAYFPGYDATRQNRASSLGKGTRSEHSFFSLLLPHAIEQQICELFKGIKTFPHMGHGRGSRGGGQTCPSFSPVNHFPQSGHLRMATASFLHAERPSPFPSGR